MLLKQDANANDIKANQTYYYEVEHGALDKHRTDNCIKVKGQTLIDMANDNFDSASTANKVNNLMRFFNKSLFR